MPKDIIAQLMKATDEHMLATIETGKREFSMIRTGRANPAILDRVLVEYYGERVPIKQVGTIDWFGAGLDGRKQQRGCLRLILAPIPTHSFVEHLHLHAQPLGLGLPALIVLEWGELREFMCGDLGTNHGASHTWTKDLASRRLARPGGRNVQQLRADGVDIQDA